ncbi:hypothetical protein FHG87_011138 [Trinorchestia longiramus]|nr:hypothetical protein FHG87_011138 [Trinorchestia longiramus]
MSTVENNSPRQPVVCKMSNVRTVKSRFRDAATARAAAGNRTAHSSSSNKISLSNSANLSDDIPKSENFSKTNSETKPKVHASSSTKPSTNVARALYKNKALSNFPTLNDKASINRKKTNSNNSGSSSNSKNCSDFSSTGAKLKYGSASPYKNTHAIKKCDGNIKENNTPSKLKTSNSSRKELKKVLTSESSSSSAASKLHSTAVNATMLNTTVQLANTSQFSSTVVSQRGRGGTPNLPELPDISAIKLDLGSRGTISENSDGSCDPTGPLTPNTILNLSDDVIVEEAENSEESHEVTPEELELLYLQYLTWYHVTTSSAAAHAAALQPALKELQFLEELVAGKEEEERDLHHKLQLLQTLQRASEVRDELLPALSALNDSSEDWCHGVQSLSHELEHHLHHLTLSPAILPDSSEEVVAPLSRVNAALSDVLQLLPPCAHHITTATSVLRDAHTLCRCSNQVQEAACLALQNCSLQLASPEHHTDA